jgi:hypothetical protein
VMQAYMARGGIEGQPLKLCERSRHFRQLLNCVLLRVAKRSGAFFTALVNHVQLRKCGRCRASCSASTAPLRILCRLIVEALV